jgi:preprotein translocase subunit SecG
MLNTVLLTVHVLVSVVLIVLVMLQQGRGADAGAAFGGGGSGTVFGAGGPGNFMTRATAVLAILFFVISLSLAYLTTQNVERKSVVERVGTLSEQTQSTSDVPVVPGAEGVKESSGDDVPAAPSGGASQ